MVNMSVRGCLILLAVLIVGTSAAKLQKPTTEKNPCVDNTEYAQHVCKDQKDGEKLLVPGSCSEYYECIKGVTQKKSCSKFFDPELKKCVSKSKCVEIDKTECIVNTTSSSTSVAHEVTPSKPATSCNCKTPAPPSSCPVVTCIPPTCPPPKKCPKPIKCPKPPKCL